MNYSLTVQADAQMAPVTALHHINICRLWLCLVLGQVKKKFSVSNCLFTNRQKTHSITKLSKYSYSWESLSFCSPSAAKLSNNFCLSLQMYSCSSSSWFLCINITFESQGFFLKNRYPTINEKCSRSLYLKDNSSNFHPQSYLLKSL